MPRLHIPLSGSTARPRRRAVWHWAGILLLGFLIRGGFHAYATRNVLAAYAPEDTNIAVLLRPTRGQWENLLRTFGDISLLYGGVTLRELRPYIRSGVALFIANDGTRRFAFQGTLSEDMARQFTSYGIHVERPQKNVVILGSKRTDGKKMETSSWWKRLAPWNEGEILMSRPAQYSTTIRERHGRWSFSSGREFSPNAIATTEKKTALRAPLARPGTKLPQIMENAFLSISNEEIKPVIQEMTKMGGNLAIFEDGGFLIRFFSATPEATIQKLLALRYGLTHPIVTRKTLPDGSFVNEILSPATPEIETLTDNGWTVFHVKSDSEELFGATSTDKERTLFTNSKEALIAETHPKKVARDVITCGNDRSLEINTQKIGSILQKGSTSLSTDESLLSNLFVNIGMYKSIFGSRIVVCTVDKVDK